MTRHRRTLTGPEATVASFAITATATVSVLALAWCPAAFVAGCIAVMLWIGFR